jgi:hypothetical protein
LEISRTVLLVKVSELILRSCLRLLLVVLLLLLARRMARVYCPRRNGRPLRDWRWWLRDVIVIMNNIPGMQIPRDNTVLYIWARPGCRLHVNRLVLKPIDKKTLD